MKDAFYDNIILHLASEMPEDLFAFYVSVQVVDRQAEKISIYDRDEFLIEYEANPLFEEFWQHITKAYREKEDYFFSLMHDSRPYDRRWIEREYYRYIFGFEFDNMHEKERRRYKADFETLRDNVHRAILEREAQRLNCHVSEVRPMCNVLVLPQGGNEESKLAGLPDAIFVKIMGLLDTIDIFRVTLVSKQWKRLVHNNPGVLKRVEHAKTTHLLTFTEWMDSSKTISRQSSRSKYRRVSQGLIQWCYGITNNLETVIVHHDILSFRLATLLQSCPNLKNLHLPCGITCEDIEEGGPLHLVNHLPNLEFYYCSGYRDNQTTNIDERILLSCNNLYCFGGSVFPNRILEDNARNRMKHVFQNLIVLDLNRYTLQVLEVLADLDNLQLKYLGLGSLITRDLPNQDLATSFARQRALLTKIFRKLKMLEILNAYASLGIRKSTIELLIQLKVKLKFAVLREVSFPSYLNEAGEREDWTSEVVADFGQMLLSNDPDLDLSQICLNVETKELWHDLQELNIGFTIRQRVDDNDINLNNILIRRYLGIDL